MSVVIQPLIFIPHFIVIPACDLHKGPSINDVSSEGEGGGHKIGKKSRRRLWMAPKIHLLQLSA